MLYICLTAVTHYDDLNVLKPIQNGRQFADNIFSILVWKLLYFVSLKYVPCGPIDHDPYLDPIIAWPRTGDKPWLVYRIQLYEHQPAMKWIPLKPMINQAHYTCTIQYFSAPGNTENKLSFYKRVQLGSDYITSSGDYYSPFTLRTETDVSKTLSTTHG